MTRANVFPTFAEEQMNNRREVLISGCVTMFFGNSCSCVASELLTGCSLSINAARPYLDEVQTSQTKKDPFVGRSGNRAFDLATANALSRMSEIFQALPSFRYFKMKNSNNAFATPVAIEKARDGTILFGKDLLFDVMSKEEGPETAFAAILAHEFGHILQFKLGINNALDRNTMNVRRSELHADFLAGYFAGVRKLEKPDFKAAVFAETKYRVGDYDINSRHHHGTPEERARSVVFGFQTAYRDKKNLLDAVLIGAKYVTSI